MYKQKHSLSTKLLLCFFDTNYYLILTSMFPLVPKFIIKLSVSSGIPLNLSFINALPLLSLISVEIPSISTPLSVKSLTSCSFKPFMG
jgi:hypothetical protein